MKIVAKIHTDFKTKFGVPRQSGLVKGLKGRIVFETGVLRSVHPVWEVTSAWGYGQQGVRSDPTILVFHRYALQK